MLYEQIEEILPLVQKPGRYTGGELNSVVKDKSKVSLRFAFCFPDTYEIGMSHLGIKILYSLINSRDNYWCERVFAPDCDMEKIMRERHIPLFGLESRDSLKDFDCIGFKGIYVPSLYDVSYNSDGTVKAYTPLCGAPKTVDKRVVADIDKMFYPEKFVVPFVEIVHDRVVAEIFRGCIRGCRFCQAGFWYRPIREKSVETISKQSKRLACTSGYDELSLCSLSSSDYTKITELIEELLGWTVPEKINVALPSLRIDNFSDGLKEKLALVRRSGLTFAAEAGTQRLRDVINKNITEAEILDTCNKAFSGGWTAVKLYFMIGLPTETDDDVVGINVISQKVVDEFYNNPNRPKGKAVAVSDGVSSFVPKPFTPFQWEAQDTREELKRKQDLLKSTCTSKKITFRFHNTDMTYLEAVLARGDRKVGAVIEDAWRNGCTFDSWDDKFKIQTWLDSFKRTGISPEFYANRKRDYSEVLPWDVINAGIRKEFLIAESEKARRAETTCNCREKCAGCGSNMLNGGKCDALCKNMVQ